MKRINVASSSIKSVGYDLIGRLEIEFQPKKENKIGAIYQYKKVSPGVVCDLIFAESVGKYFHQNIEKNYDYEKIGE